MNKILLQFAVITMVMTTTGITSVKAKVVAKTVDYNAQGMVMKGYLAYDDAMKGKRPGVLVVPEVPYLVGPTKKSGRNCWVGAMNLMRYFSMIRI